MKPDGYNAMSNAHPLKVLILEDQPGGCELLLDELRRSGFSTEWFRVETEAEYLQNLHKDLDLILADYTLPQFNAPKALAWLQQHGLDIPFIVVTGTISEDAVVECMKQGAADCLLRDRLARLGKAVEQALEAKHLRDEKRAADIALRQSEAFNRAVLNSLTAHIAVVNHEGKIVAVNDAWTHFALENGVTSLERTDIGSNYLLTCQQAAERGDADAAQSLNGIRSVLEGIQPRFALEYPCHSPSEQRWFSMRVTPLGDGSGGAVISHFNVTDRKLSEEALRKSEERFSKAFHASPAGIFIVQLSDGSVVDVNESFIELTGYPRDELVGHNVVDLNLWDSTQEQIQLLTLLREQGFIRDREQALHTKAGTFRHTLVSAEAIELGGEACVLALIFDVTDRDRVQEERMNAEVLRVELGKERDLLELKEQFLSKLSHDFRTPLAVIQASSDLLSQYFDRLTPEKRLRYAQEIQAQIKVMTEMMEEVLVINRAQAGKLGAHPSPLNLVGFCHTLFEDMQLIDIADHEFVFTSDGQIDHVAMDEKLLRHILVNLLTNAIKYSPNGGTIRFDVLPRNEHIVFRISDQGIGIPEEDQARLFEEFYRAKNTGQIAGTGLGLAIVKRSVEAHGGTMEVESKVGVGTTFTVHLPTNFKSGQQSL
ncbi:MAG: sensor histidine kinase [Aggregatilineales bacterium]